VRFARRSVLAEFMSAWRLEARRLAQARVRRTGERIWRNSMVQGLGAELVMGNTRTRVFHTPGHTPESICLVVTDLRRGPEPWFVLTGDTLLSGAVGRPDLPGQERKNAATLYDSIQPKLLTLLETLEIYSAHFGGSACGAGLSGKPSSTLGFEKRYNPLLSMDRETFIEALSVSMPKPADLERVVRFNRGEESRRCRA